MSIPIKELVLVVDDEPFYRDILSRVLSRAGYPVVQASTGAETERLIYENRGIKGVVMDNEMGEGPKGLQILRDLRASQDSRLREMPVLICCSDPDSLGNPVDAQEIRGYGADFVAKPFEIPYFLAVADRVFLSKNRDSTTQS